MNQATQIIPLDAQKQAQESKSLLQTYESYEVTTAEAYSGAGADLKAIKAKWKEVDTLRKSLTKPLDESKKKLMDFFRAPLQCLKDAEAIVSGAMVVWHKEQERKRQAEEARIREAQQKEASRLAKLAAKAEQRGDKKKAQAFDNRADEVSYAAPAVVPKTTKIAGLAVTATWKCRIVDVSKIPRYYLLPNKVMLGQLAKSSKGLFKVEGVEFYSVDSVRGTRT